MNLPQIDLIGVKAFRFAIDVFISSLDMQRVLCPICLRHPTSVTCDGSNNGTSLTQLLGFHNKRVKLERQFQVLYEIARKLGEPVTAAEDVVPMRLQSVLFVKYNALAAKANHVKPTELKAARRFFSARAHERRRLNEHAAPSAAAVPADEMELDVEPTLADRIAVIHKCIWAGERLIFAPAVEWIGAADGSSDVITVAAGGKSAAVWSRDGSAPGRPLATVGAAPIDKVGQCAVFVDGGRVLAAWTDGQTGRLAASAQVAIDGLGESADGMQAVAVAKEMGLVVGTRTAVCMVGVDRDRAIALWETPAHGAMALSHCAGTILCATGDGAVVAIEADTGAIRWRARPSPSPTRLVACGPAEVAVVASADGFLSGLAMADGATRGTVALSDDVIVDMAVGESDAMVLCKNRVVKFAISAQDADPSDSMPSADLGN